MVLSACSTTANWLSSRYFFRTAQRQASRRWLTQPAFLPLIMNGNGPPSDDGVSNGVAMSDSSRLSTHDLMVFEIDATIWERTPRSALLGEAHHKAHRRQLRQMRQQQAWRTHSKPSPRRPMMPCTCGSRPRDAVGIWPGRGRQLVGVPRPGWGGDGFSGNGTPGLGQRPVCPFRLRH